ncbi:MAG: Lrp/AsnC family transcriptional regulator [Acidimicrobiaceae bacterium]|nr:Lrp/AsnC family transcriptional regulator [Acidimicrobiaceae bacterium]
MDPAVLGYGLFAFAFIEVPGGALEAGHSLGRRHDTAFVVAVGGSASLIVEFRCRDWQHLVVTLDDVRRDPSFAHAKIAILQSYHKHDWSSLHSGGVVALAEDERPAYTVDAIDMDILKVLAEDGRATYADIARRVAVSQGTARMRMTHLEEAGAVTVQTVISPGILGLSGYAAVGLDVDGSTKAVAEKVAQLVPVALVASVFGAFDVIVEVGYRDPAHLVETLDSLRSIPGVKRLESFSYLIEVKESMEAGLWGP